MPADALEIGTGEISHSVPVGGFDRVHAVRIGADWARELNRLKTFGRLASARAADGRVYVDLPDALQVLRPETGSDLE